VYRYIKERCYDIQEHKYFNNFFLSLIYVNTVLMAIEHHGMDKSLENGLLIANFVFTFFFTVEVAVKLIGLVGL
jgi:hypothetical protein